MAADDVRVPVRRLQPLEASVAASVAGGGWGSLQKPLVWAHALSSSRGREDGEAVWDLSRCAPVVRYDALGHGLSSGPAVPDAYTWQALAADMQAVAVAAQAESGAPAYIAGGASMGCATALWAAVQNPASVLALLLVIPPTCRKRRSARGAALQRMAEEAETAAGFARLTARPRRKRQPAFVPVARLMPRDLPNAAAAGALFRGTGASDLPSDDAIRGIAAPALILAWEDDPTHPVETAHMLHSLLPSSRIVVSSAADNTVHQWGDIAAEFLRAVRQVAKC
eukprot:TRINITY_DN5526_c0_g1_i1.p1 TRINITY_DN5526_c0_g1~~TRINITY_DN5526_c0_g1_i1.p1  ORF type:complete len:296 (+),score=90.06 TRINITY_DN5526_c0_g1_i1:43-888(+)